MKDEAKKVESMFDGARKMNDGSRKVPKPPKRGALSAIENTRMHAEMKKLAAKITQHEKVISDSAARTKTLEAERAARLASIRKGGTMKGGVL